MPGEDGNPARWQDELYDLLRRHNVIQFAYVPDAGHRILIDRSLADPGVALLAGADLGGARGVLRTWDVSRVEQRPHPNPLPAARGEGTEPALACGRGDMPALSLSPLAGRG